MADLHEIIADLNVQGQLFFYFASQRFLGRFARLNLPTREFPQAAKQTVFLTFIDEQIAFVPDQPHGNLVMRHLFSGRPGRQARRILAFLKGQAMTRNRAKHTGRAPRWRPEMWSSRAT